ncbi:MAG TPA: protein TolR [Solimonas sp.]|nr:protein TolR [Solimonas sp.]
MARRKLSSEINVVPYIDVMLVLLIIFMVTAPLLVQGIEVDLPDADAASLTAKDQDVIFSVNTKGEFFLNVGDSQGSPLSEAELTEKVGAILRNKPEQMILVQGDAGVVYERVARGMAVLQNAGARRIGFVTQPIEGSPGTAAQQ